MMQLGLIDSSKCADTSRTRMHIISYNMILLSITFVSTEISWVFNHLFCFEQFDLLHLIIWFVMLNI
jgi:hypothetical protein